MLRCLKRTNYWQEFEVYDNLLKPVILGHNFLLRKQAVIDYGELTIRLSGQNIKFACGHTDADRLPKISHDYDEEIAKEIDVVVNCIKDVEQAELLSHILKENISTFSEQPGRLIQVSHHIQLKQ